MIELEQNYRVIFLHPRSGDTWPVDVSSGLTAGEALAQLTKHGFLAPSESSTMVLSIERTGTTIPPTLDFAAAGVRAGDNLPIIEVHPGGAAEVRSCPR